MIFSLAWALGLAAFMSLPAVGFSLEVGGLWLASPWLIAKSTTKFPRKLNLCAIFLNYFLYSFWQ